MNKITPKANQKFEALLAEIAKQHLHLETLEARNMDSLDFSDQAVWSIREALIAAYEKGVEAGAKSGDRCASLKAAKEAQRRLANTNAQI